MSGWNQADQMMEEDSKWDFPCVNNITVAGYLPHDSVPSPGKSKRITSNSPLKYSQEQIIHGGPFQECETFQTVLPLHALHRQLRWHS